MSNSLLSVELKILIFPGGVFDISSNDKLFFVLQILTRFNYMLLL